MSYIHLIVLFLTGFTLVNLISPKFSVLEKLGLSFSLAIGLVTMIMLPYDLLGVKINLTSLYIPQVLIIIFGLFFLVNKHGVKEVFSLNGFDKMKSANFFSINLPWIFLALILGYVMYVVIAKAMFWPTISFDSVTGYDFVGRLIALEGKVNSSMFDPELPYNSIRSGYPLFIPGGFGYAYLMGFDSSKITTVILILSTLFIYYGLLRNYANHTISMLFTVLFITTPEYIAMSALSLSNVPHTLLVIVAVLALAIWMDRGEKRYFYIGVIFMALNVWARSDGIIFIAGAGFALFLYTVKTKAWKELVIFGVSAVLPFIIWQLYLKGVLGMVNTDVFVSHLFWDGEKIDRMTELIWKVITSTQFYGIAPYLIPIGVLINYQTILKKHTYLLVAILTSFLIYTMLYYQMNNGSEDFGYSLKAMINSSYKRGMFSIIGLFYFYIAISPMVQKLSKFVIESPSKNA